MFELGSLCDSCDVFQGDDISRISVAAKIVERMVNQNTYDDIAQGILGFLPQTAMLLKHE